MPGVLKLDWYTVHGVKPCGEGAEEFLVEVAYVESLRDRRLDAKYYDAILLEDVLKSPSSIFSGLKRSGLASEGYCYCSKPPTRYLENAVQVASPPGMVFAVYIFDNLQKDSLAVVDWDWRREDKNAPGHPEYWQHVYEERTWPTT